MAGVRWHIIRTILVCVCLLSFSFYGMAFFSLSDFMLIVGDFLFYSFKATLYYATTMPYDNFTFLITLRLQNIFTLYVCVCVCVLRGVPIIRSSSRVNLLLPVCFLSRKCGVLGSLSIHFLFVLFHFLRCSREFFSPFFVSFFLPQIIVWLLFAFESRVLVFLLLFTTCCRLLPLFRFTIPLIVSILARSFCLASFHLPCTAFWLVQKLLLFWLLLASFMLQ